MMGGLREILMVYKVLAMCYRDVGILSMCGRYV